MTRDYQAELQNAFDVARTDNSLPSLIACDCLGTLFRFEDGKVDQDLVDFLILMHRRGYGVTVLSSDPRDVNHHALYRAGLPRELCVVQEKFKVYSSGRTFGILIDDDAGLAGGLSCLHLWNPGNIHFKAFVRETLAAAGNPRHRPAPPAGSQTPF